MTVMYDFVNFPRDIAGTPFPSANSQIQPTHVRDNRGEYCTHETSCPASKGSLLGSLMMRASVKLGDGWNMGVFYGCAMCELRHPLISTSRRRTGSSWNAKWLQVPSIGVDKLLSGFKYGLDKSAVVSIAGFFLRFGLYDCSRHIRFELTRHEAHNSTSTPN